MSSATTEPPVGDPTLAALVPAPTRTRNALLTTAAAVVLVAAWFSPQLLRPTLDGTTDGVVDVGSGGTTAVPGTHRLATAVVLDPRAVGPLTVVAVDDVPGARVVGAWVHGGDLTDASALLTWADAPSGSPEGRAGALPAAVGEGDQLEVLWQVDDCAAFDAAATVTVHLRSVLGMTTTNELTHDWNPGQMYADGWVGDDVCP